MNDKTHVNDKAESSHANYWIFSNTQPGQYDGNDWDMRTILERRQYYLKAKERNRGHVKVNDIGLIRIYGNGFWGKFRICDHWRDDPESATKWDDPSGYFPIDEILLWQRPVPQSLIWADLSTSDQRSRLVRITAKDADMIETAQRIYARLGYGSAEGEIIVLEKGIEEALKPNLERLGLRLANKDIQQQFAMGPGVGRSDLICLDRDDNLVVVELKRGLSTNEAVGQVLTYVGYLRENVAAQSQKVFGWIVTGSYDESLRLAATAAGVKVMVVRLP